LSASNAASAGTQAKPMRSTALTAGEAVARIQAQCAKEGVAWQADGVDTFKIGDPRTPVRGIVTSFMGTLNVLKRAASLGATFVVTHEPVFWSARDLTDDLIDDPLYQIKTRFARQHDLVVWRFHDHWHRISPEPMSLALMRQLGWERYVDPSSRGYTRHFNIPPQTLASLAQDISRRLPTRSLRVVGDPAMVVTKVGNSSHSVADVIRMFEVSDVLISPEVREFETVEYIRDAAALGFRKAAILIAHERGEEGGMQVCADWMRPLFPNLPITFISAAEPFLTPPFASSAR